MKNWALCATLAFAAGGVWAQTSTTTTAPTTAIGVTPQDAREATQKAIPKANTATLVRTEPSAAAQAEQAAKDVKKAVTSNNTTSAPSKNATATTSGSGTGTGSNQASSSGAGVSNTGVAGNGNTTTRASRADRN